MILLRDPPLIFLKPHKVAGTSFEIALSRYAGRDDIITPFGQLSRADRDERARRGYMSARNYAYPWYQLPTLPLSEWRFALNRRQWPKRFRSHLSAAKIKERLGNNLWSRSLKVSIVRNPFDRAVSAYFWRRSTDESFADFLARAMPYLRGNYAQYLIDGEDCVDHYLRYESLAPDIAMLEQRLPALAGLGETFASLSAKSGRRPKSASVQEMFASAPEAAGMIEENLRFEIDKFGYRLDDCD